MDTPYVFTTATNGIVVEEVGALGAWTFYIVTLIFLISAIGMGYMSFRKEDNSLLVDRLHHYITFAIVMIATLAYYAMAGGGGSVAIEISHSGPDHVYRLFYFARYIDWLFTTPLLLVDLILLGDMTIHHTGRIIFYDVLMIVTGLFGGLSHGWHKWGWWIIGCVFMFLIFYDLLVIARAKVFRRSEQLGQLYTSLVGLLIGAWLLYPIVWALAEGADWISLDLEILLYGILDVTAKVIFGWVLLTGIAKESVAKEAHARTGNEVEGGSYEPLNTNA